MKYIKCLRLLNYRAKILIYCTSYIVKFLKIFFFLETKSVKASSRRIYVVMYVVVKITPTRLACSKDCVVKPWSTKCSSFKGLTVDSRGLPRFKFVPSSLSPCKPPAENSSFGRLTFDSYSSSSRRSGERSF